MNLYLEIFNFMIVPLVFLGAGLLMSYFPPKYRVVKHKKYGTVVKVYGGYKTKNSMKNKENWNKAQKLFTKYLISSGVLTFFLALACYMLFKNNLISPITILIILMATLAIQMTGCFMYIEAKLKRIS